MSKKKKNKSQGGQQQFLSPEQYLKQRARTLPIYQCYINDNADEAGMAMIIVTRKHTGGRISLAGYMVDMYCLGVKDTYYKLRIEEEELEELLERQQMEFRECSYEEAHNRIYGAIAFAEEGGIEPHKDFRLTQYMLEEDTDDIPLIEYEYGQDGKHFLCCQTNLEASRYLPTLRKHLGDNFDYLIGLEHLDADFDGDDEDDFDDDFDDVDDFDDDDDDDFDDDEAPINISDCLEEIDAEQLQSMALVLGIQINLNDSPEQQLQQYVDGILSDPEEVLMRLPTEDLELLEIMAEDNDRYITYPDTGAEPLMYHLGLIDYCETYDDCIEYRVAEDFWKAVRPHLKRAKKEEVNQVRLTVESIIQGLVNLYGSLSYAEIKKMVCKILGMPSETFDELYEMLLPHSVLLLHLYHHLDTENAASDDEQVVAFTSRFGWESTPALYKAIHERDGQIPKPCRFTMKEVISACAPIPVIPNKSQKAFMKFLRSQLGYDDDMAELICHRLWLRAQHEDNPDNPHGRYLDYFTKEVIVKAPKKAKLAVLSEGMQALQDYMNAMPRWILKGYSPEQISSKGKSY